MTDKKTKIDTGMGQFKWALSVNILSESSGGDLWQTS